jgi:hypothetical protein
LKSPTVPRPTQQLVGTPDDRGTFVAEVRGREAESLPVIQDQISVTFEILLVGLGFAVTCAVALMNSTGALDQQIDTRHEAAVLIENLMLWLDGDVRCYV